MPTRKSFSLLACLVAFTAIVWTGCGPTEEETAAVASEQEWTWLQETKQQLDSKRQELATLRQQLRDAPVQEASAVEPAADAAPAAGSRADLEARIAALESEITTLGDEFGGRLVTFINSFETVEGEAMPERQQQAIRMKSDEDIEVAQEWIEKGGDYRRAIEIYESQRQVDPGYDRLEQALARAQEMRYMTEERFAQVDKGMTQSQVREVLGPVNLHNVKKYEDRGIEAWFYPKDGGGAAGVFFRLDEDRNAYTVYQTKFDVAAGESAPGSAAG